MSLFKLYVIFCRRHFLRMQPREPVSVERARGDSRYGQMACNDPLLVQPRQIPKASDPKT